VDGHREGEPAQTLMQTYETQDVVEVSVGQDDTTEIARVHFQAVEIVDQSSDAAAGIEKQGPRDSASGYGDGHGEAVCAFKGRRKFSGKELGHHGIGAAGTPSFYRLGGRCH
jgi:hypothetical protein